MEDSNSRLTARSEFPDKSNIDISICIPSYNGEGTIKRCIDSVLNQNDLQQINYEIIISDDGSNDGTLDILSAYKDNTRIKIYPGNGHKGFTRNWNKAISLGKGDFRTLLHQDDWFEPDTLKYVFDRFRNASIVLLALAHYSHVIDKKTKQEVHWNVPGEFSANKYYNLLLRFKECPAPTGTFLRNINMGDKDLYNSKYRFCPEFSLYLETTLNNPEGLFVIDNKLMINRQTSADQYSKINIAYEVIDYIKIFNTYSNKPMNADPNISFDNLSLLIRKRIYKIFNTRRFKQLFLLMINWEFNMWILMHPFTMIKTFGAIGIYYISVFINRIIRRPVSNGK